MKRVEKIKLLSNHLFEKYTMRTFNPQNEFQINMMNDIIKHEAEEEYDLTELTDIELRFIQLEVQTLYKIEFNENKNKI
jgi:hypothetical protein